MKTKTKKILLTGLLALTPTLLMAADQDLEGTKDTIISTMRYIVNIVGLVAMALVIAFNGGFAYLFKSKEDRGQEDGQALKQLAIRVVVGGALILGAFNIGPEIWDLLGGN